MKASVVSLALVVLLAVVPFATAASTHTTRSANFPARGIVVPGQSIGSLTLGMTQAAVTTHWGKQYVICGAGCGKSALVTWLYEYRGPEPLGAAVRFLKGKVVAIFTLGSPVGWGLKGVMMGDPISNVYNVFGSPGTKNCIGYTALTERIGNSTTAIYSANGVVYGYALTAPTQSPCQ
ncbi:MAG TPA: hypothetical protein VH063_16600 [Gaiellaceae bacterium]|jgi:hypothetical protein|nr:hypothetical protein [Gaiellaceae bacterium]